VCKIKKKLFLASFSFHPLSTITLVVSSTASQSPLPPPTTHQSFLQHMERRQPFFSPGQASHPPFFSLKPPQSLHSICNGQEISPQGHWVGPMTMRVWAGSSPYSWVRSSPGKKMVQVCWAAIQPN
jgi:hypothetical protein